MENNENKALESANAEHDAQLLESRVPGQVVLCRFHMSFGGRVAVEVCGAPRIHGELLKLGIAAAQSTVARYLPRLRKPPSQTWRPEPRGVEPPEQGRVVAIPQVGGLHHRYQRRAA